jgi:hypothetical protein
VECPPAICRGDLAEQLRRFSTVSNDLRETITLYFGWPLIGAAGLAGIISPHRRRKMVMVLIIFTLGAT